MRKTRERWVQKINQAWKSKFNETEIDVQWRRKGKRERKKRKMIKMSEKIRYKNIKLDREIDRDKKEHRIQERPKRIER